MSLIADLFPGIVLDSATYADLQVAISNQVEAAGLINHPPWNLKLVQVDIVLFQSPKKMQNFFFFLYSPALLTSFVIIFHQLEKIIMCQFFIADAKPM